MIVGFVASRALAEPSVGGLGLCGTGRRGGPVLWGDAENAPRVEIGAGRFLLDTEQPVVVGCVEKSTQLAELGDGRYAVPTHWGPIPVRLAPESVQGQCGKPRP